MVFSVVKLCIRSEHAPVTQDFVIGPSKVTWPVTLSGLPEGGGGRVPPPSSPLSPAKHNSTFRVLGRYARTTPTFRPADNTPVADDVPFLITKLLFPSATDADLSHHWLYLVCRPSVTTNDSTINWRWFCRYSVSKPECTLCHSFTISGYRLPKDTVPICFLYCCRIQIV